MIVFKIGALAAIAVVDLACFNDRVIDSMTLMGSKAPVVGNDPADELPRSLNLISVERDGILVRMVV